MTTGLQGIRAILFDAYGTLFRFDGIERACAAFLAGRDDAPSPAALTALWRAKQIEYAVHRSLMGEDRYVGFPAVTAEALDYALAAHRLKAAAAEREALLGAWWTPPADPAARGVLAALAPLPRAILSNGTPEMLAAAVAAAGLGSALDAILSVETVRVYKPHPRVYALGAARFGLRPEEIGFVSANAWDVAGAGVFEFRVCWLNRTGAPPDRHGPPPGATIATLAELPALLGA